MTTSKPAPGATAPSAALTSSQGPGAGSYLCTSETCQDRDCPRWASGPTVPGANVRACGGELGVVDTLRAQLESSREDVRRLLAVQGVRP